jgi:hypothetical protein
VKDTAKKASPTTETHDPNPWSVQQAHGSGTGTFLLTLMALRHLPSSRIRLKLLKWWSLYNRQPTHSINCNWASDQKVRAKPTLQKVARHSYDSSVPQTIWQRKICPKGLKILKLGLSCKHLQLTAKFTNVLQQIALYCLLCGALRPSISLSISMFLSCTPRRSIWPCRYCMQEMY